MHTFPPELIRRLKFVIRTVILWGVTPCFFLNNTKNSIMSAASFLKTEASYIYEAEAVVFPNTLVPIYQITRRHNVRHSNLLTSTAANTSNLSSC
jgi:hypothetical protein